LSKYNKEATINYSMINKFKCENLYRFYCLSLFRDVFYYARPTLKDISILTKEKESSLKNFNKKYDEVCQRSIYYIDKNYGYGTKRSLYYIPAMEIQCITISNKIVHIDLGIKEKGYFIKLMLLSTFSDKQLSKSNIINELGMDKKTIDKYNINLKNAGLIDYKKDYIILHTDGILMRNDFKNQKKVV